MLKRSIASFRRNFEFVAGDLTIQRYASRVERLGVEEEVFFKGQPVKRVVFIAEERGTIHFAVLGDGDVYLGKDWTAGLPSQSPEIGVTEYELGNGLILCRTHSGERINLRVEGSKVRFFGAY